MVGPTTPRSTETLSPRKVIHLLAGMNYLEIEGSSDVLPDPYPTVIDDLDDCGLIERDGDRITAPDLESVPDDVSYEEFLLEQT